MRTGTSIEYYAPCTLGVEPALERELIHLGALEVESQPGGVRFRGDRRLGYTANLWLRSAIRVQELLDRFPAASPEELYKGAQRIDWAELMSVDDTLLIDSTVADSAIRHSKYAALVVKDGIVDWFRERLGRRPSVDRLRPTLPMKLVIRNNRASLWRNLSGPSLHKRGWRPIQVKSPLNESTAAGLLLMTGWDAKSTLVDPMCGSGTFVIEAALLAADRAPGRNRAFAFERWPDFDAALWESIKSAADDRAKASLPFAIQGADRHGGAIEIANKSAREAGVSDLVRFDRRDARDFAPREQPSIVVVNPPFGKRVGEGEGLVDSWRDLGNFLHESAVGAAAWVLCGNKDLTRHLGLKSNERHVVRNGQIDCRWLRYDVGAQAGHVARGERPAPWVTRFASRVPKQGRVLDLACGTGRHVALFTEQGHQVTAVDRDLSQLGAIADHTQVETIEADLEGGAWPLEGRRFDGIVVTNFLSRALLPKLLEALAEGGVLIYETFAVGQERFGKPTNSDFLLRPNELLDAFGSLEVVAFAHGEFREPKPAMRQRICALRPL